ncbi:PH domain-containing protein [Clostridium lundense]|uniref:PH domain-containing protein n=1 Tax=Clostridium lundense TaxID=319475 RepID=UPI0004807A51|nr:PH domain-containing protein [Clostridium lundense]
MAEIQPKIVALSGVNTSNGSELYEFLILNDEEILISYKSVRDRLIVTNKRLIVIDVQGITGKKKEFMIIPFSKISTFSCESAGTFDIDAEMKVWCSGLGRIEFEFMKGTDIKPLLRILSMYVC